MKRGLLNNTHREASSSPFCLKLCFPHILSVFLMCLQHSWASLHYKRRSVYPADQFHYSCSHSSFQWCIILFISLPCCRPPARPPPTLSRALRLSLLAAHVYLSNGSQLSSFGFLFLPPFALHSLSSLLFLTWRSPSPLLRRSWCLWWTYLHLPSSPRSPPSSSYLPEPSSSSSSSSLSSSSHRQSLPRSSWSPGSVTAAPQSSSSQSERRSSTRPRLTRSERWPNGREPLPVLATSAFFKNTDHVKSESQHTRKQKNVKKC